MTYVVGLVLFLVGAWLVGFAPRIARTRVSLHYSPEDVAATTGPRHRRVRRVRIAACALNVVFGVVLVYAGLSVVFSWSLF